MTERSGRCLCGQASYRLTGEPVRVRTCWCRSCQRIAANGIPSTWRCRPVRW
ncbi:GFA family protein [Laribacter hongkongensis]|uniref:GFA family protein n=1 Tax=Laribacter hongkongensis TaxID=168471 RepID=UPI004032AE26